MRKAKRKHTTKEWRTIALLLCLALALSVIEPAAMTVKAATQPTGAETKAAAENTEQWQSPQQAAGPQAQAAESEAESGEVSGVSGAEADKERQASAADRRAAAKETMMASETMRNYDASADDSRVTARANYPGNREAFKNADELKAALDEKTHIAKAVDPENVQVNLFDYYVQEGRDGSKNQDDRLEKNEQVSHGSGTTSVANEDAWNQGINKDKLLLFGDSMVYAGFWNLGAGAGRKWGKDNTNMKNIVKPVLGKDGYPQINIEEAQKSIKVDTDNDITFARHAERKDGGAAAGKNLSSTVLENAGAIKTGSTWDTSKVNTSLAYLFAPEDEAANANKSSYKNINGLFQLNDEGYYYYYARQNFAELKQDQASPDSDGSFKLYDGPAMWRTDGGYNQGTDTFDGDMSLGNFFPFNTGEQVFDSVDKQSGKLSSSENLTNTKLSDPTEEAKKVNQATKLYNNMNHHMGMTVEMEFRQPVDGMVNAGSSGNKPMTFQFSGDDDVWVFIDDVLVLDIGGIHSELYGTIDFSTGKVAVGQSWRTGGQFPDDYNGTYPGKTDETTILDCFQKAGKADSVSWKGNTFSSNTSHTIKMFYLERGNYDSSLALRFNLQPLLRQQVKKVDQTGSPMGDVEFTMHPAELASEGEPDAIRCANVVGSDNKAKYIKQTNDQVLAKLKTTEDGIATFNQVEGNTETETPYNFADNYESDSKGRFYILEEASTPAGYRPLPIPIVLEFNPDTTMLSVANRWTTGAYASFNSFIFGNSKLSYAQFDPDTADLEATADIVAPDDQENGLVMAVPMLWQQANQRWRAMYGDNTKGFQTVIPENRTAEAWREAALNAMLHQCADADSPDWYLQWNEKEGRLNGTLSDLPGRADRYQLIDKDGDMRMVYAIIDKKALDKLGVTGDTSQERYESLRQHILNKDPKSINAAVKGTLQELTLTGAIGVRDFSFLNVDEFNRNFRSLIYIPNEQRELRVQKVDEDGTAINGAEFGLYDNNDREVAAGKTAAVNGQDGMLIFTPKPETEPDHATVKDGYAKMEWASSQRTQYYLKEKTAPAGYTLNPTKVPVIVGTYAIYADAGTKDDGVTVMAGVGKLAQTMTKYASDETVNITLRDIKAIGQTQKSGTFDLEGWEDMKLDGADTARSMNLHYGRNAVVDYGLHDEDGGKNLNPFFVTDTGFVRARVQQNYEALSTNLYGDSVDNSANKDDLGDTSITSLFSLLNIVVVTDKTETKPEKETGQLSIRKTVAGPGLTKADHTKLFDFTVGFSKTGEAADKAYYFYSNADKSGFVKSGDTIPLHHDETITIAGLPVGTEYVVTEKPEQGFVSSPGAMIKGTIAAKDAVEAAHFTNTKDQVITTPPDPKAPGLRIEKEQSLNDGSRTKKPLTAKADDKVTYYLTVKNIGRQTAEHVTVTDMIPSGLQLVAGSISDQGTEKDGTITWHLGDLKAGERRTVSFQVTVPETKEKRRWDNVTAATYSNNPKGPNSPAVSNEVTVETSPPAITPQTGDASGYETWIVLALFALLTMIISAMGAIQYRQERLEK